VAFGEDVCMLVVSIAEDLIRSPDVYIGDIPLAISLHATKSFGTGEGGVIATTNAELAMHAMRTLNFGFHGTRDSLSASTNGKMSEYNAAVGLAELDDWGSKYSALSNVMALYRQSMETVQLSKFLCTSPDISTSYALLVCRTSDEAKAAERSLDHHNIDCRRWYGTGVQHHTYFSALPRDRLESTDDILPRLIGLPVAPDLTEPEVQRVVAAVRERLSG
jgi:dTDP-4-amino-4,6-dideoxygalactose transaminase